MSITEDKKQKTLNLERHQRKEGERGTEETRQIKEGEKKKKLRKKLMQEVKK